MNINAQHGDVYNRNDDGLYKESFLVAMIKDVILPTIDFGLMVGGVIAVPVSVVMLGGSIFGLWGSNAHNITTPTSIVAQADPACKIISPKDGSPINVAMPVASCVQVRAMLKAKHQ